MPGTLRPKRQLYREDIPHHRPLTGNTYYLHAGFPHPSRWHDGEQVIKPNPNPVTHHHLHRKPGLHDDVHGNNNHDHHNNHLNFNNEHQHQLGHIFPNNNHLSPHNHHLSPAHQQAHNGPHHSQQPVAISFLNNKTPHSVNIHSSIVHSNGLNGGNVVDNALGNPHAPVSPADQANFDPLFNPLISGPPEPTTGQLRNSPGYKPGKPPKPHSDPEPYDDYGTGGDYGTTGGDYGAPAPLKENPLELQNQGANQPERKPKTIIHYHPVTVGNIINFNEDNKPELVKPVTYGPPDHVPGYPLSNNDVMLSVAEPFMKSPFKSVNGPSEYLENSVQYGPPQHVPGVPLGNFDLSPMVPSYGPPLKPENEAAVGVALPVIAHLHSGPPHHHHHHHHHPPPPKHFRGKGRGYHRTRLHLHHIHHPPPHPQPALAPLTGPFYDHPTYVVHGHVPKLHHPHFRSQSHHHKAFWSW